jgi:hypothetical protein
MKNLTEERSLPQKGIVPTVPETKAGEDGFQSELARRGD